MFILFCANVECYWRCVFVILIPGGFFFFSNNLCHLYSVWDIIIQCLQTSDNIIMHFCPLSFFIRVTTILFIDLIAQARHHWTHYHANNKQRPPESLAFPSPCILYLLLDFPNKSLTGWYCFHITLPLQKKKKKKDGNKVLRLDWWYWNGSDSQQQCCQPETRCLHYL